MKRQFRERLARWYRRRQGVDSLPLTLARRRLYVLPTRAGYGFALLLILMLVAGLNYANSLALFFTFFLGGFTLVVMHQCHRNMLGTQLLIADAQPTFAQHPGTLHLTFENPATNARFRIAAGVDKDPTTATDLPARGRNQILLSVPAPKRGIVHLDRIHLITTHPFGLFRTWTWVHAPIQMLVYPQPRGLLPMPTGAGNKSGTTSLADAGADEWMGLRPFRDGDSPRQVDWKAYAREAPLLVKEYSAQASESRMFDFGRLPNLQTEERLEQMTRWVVSAEAGGERYGLRLPGTYIAPDRGPEHRHRCLSALAMFALEDGAGSDGQATRR
jgi:uncharacterized protein (DUF58 family)